MVTLVLMETKIKLFWKQPQTIWKILKDFLDPFLNNNVVNYSPVNTYKPETIKHLLVSKIVILYYCSFFMAIIIIILYNYHFQFPLSVHNIIVRALLYVFCFSSFFVTAHFYRKKNELVMDLWLKTRIFNVTSPFK